MFDFDEGTGALAAAGRRFSQRPATAAAALISSIACPSKADCFVRVAVGRSGVTATAGDASKSSLLYRRVATSAER